MPESMLAVKDLHAWYGESHVLHGVNFAVNHGEVVTLLGRNGVGKTTTMKSIMGMVGRRAGSIAFEGTETIALQRKRGASFDFWRSQRVLEELDGRARELITAVGLADYETAIAVELPYGRKRALEIATTLALDPEMMLLDEPTAGMTHEDVERITQLIKTVAQGRTVLMVEHNMSVVSGISDTITVLQRGSILAEGPYSEVSRDPQVMEAYMGTEHA